MELRALRYFQTVAEFGSLSRASEFLRISQPAVSRQIRKLETELGRRLFTRHGHGVSLTEAGRRLLEHGQRVLRQLEQARDEVRGDAKGPSGIVTLAVAPAAGYYLVPALVERVARELPDVQLKIVGGFSGYIHEWLVRGQVDLACLHDPLPRRGFEIAPLVAEPVFLVGKPDDTRFAAGHARIEDLARLPLILPSRPNASRRMLDSWVARRRITPNIVMEVDDHSIIRALIRRGIGFSLLTQCAIADDVAAGKLQAWPIRPAVAWQLALVGSTELLRSELAGAVAESVRAVMRDLTSSGAWPGLPRAKARRRPARLNFAPFSS
ncbi:MAG: LysR family transcriptional regulator [Alphaproteobacteria bacterium]|nr:LysR family transcriptional regulator [Alphaproteobacteria bacterium]